jgi:hypothetical protein
MTYNMRVGSIQNRQVAPREQLVSDGFCDLVVAFFEVLNHFHVEVLEHVFHVLVAIDTDTRIHVQVVEGARWGVGVETVAERNGVGVTDRVIGVCVGLRDRGGGGAVLRRRSRLLASVLGRKMLVRSLNNRIACARVMIVD